jgi:DUF2407 C-terminal domain
MAMKSLIAAPCSEFEFNQRPRQRERCCSQGHAPLHSPSVRLVNTGACAGDRRARLSFACLMRLRVLVGGREVPTIVDVSAHAEPTLADLKSEIFRSAETLSPTRHRLRIIVEGKVLLDGDASPGGSRPLASLGIGDGSVLHCGVSERQAAGPAETFPSGARFATTQARDETRLNVPAPVHRLPAARRNDRGPPGAEVVVHIAVLVNRDDCEIIGEVDAGSHSRDAGRHENYEALPYMPSPSHVLRPPPTEFGQDAGPSIEEQDEMIGGWPDMLTGCMLGCGLGLIMLVLTWDKTMVFSRNFQAGIRCGVFCNFVVGLALLMSEGGKIPLY